MIPITQQGHRAYIHEQVWEQIVFEISKYSNSKDTISEKITPDHSQAISEYLMEKLILGFVIRTGGVLVPVFYEPETPLLQPVRTVSG